MIKNKSPLRFPGGKTRACKIIYNILNKNTDINKFEYILSPFFGGGSFEFYLHVRHNLNIIANDKFEPLYNFWEQSKKNNTRLCENITNLRPISKENFLEYRNLIMTVTNDLKQASYYFAINRSSFSGATLSGGFSKNAADKRFTLSSIERIKNLNLCKCDFFNLDFEIFIEIFKNENNLIFLDPPYYLKKKLYGVNGDLHQYFDHTRLYNTIKDLDNWILCYNDCEYIRQMYNNYKIISVDWKYGMNKTKKSSEILILNL